MKYFLINLLILLIVMSIQQSQQAKQTIVSITFDDGLESQYKFIKEYHINSTLYILPGLSEFEGQKLMSMEQIRELYSLGNEIGCHTMTHVNLSKEDSFIVEKELKECKEKLAEFNPVSFSYPYGAIGHEDIVKKYFKSAKTTKQGINKNCSFNLKVLILVHNRWDQRIKWLKEWIKEGGWIVISIHGIKENPRGLIDITPEEFKELIEILKKSNVKIMKVGDVIENKIC